jgi:hypothetical protein
LPKPRVAGQIVKVAGSSVHVSYRLPAPTTTRPLPYNDAPVLHFSQARCPDTALLLPDLSPVSWPGNLFSTRSIRPRHLEWSKSPECLDYSLMVSVALTRGTLRSGLHPLATSRPRTSFLPIPISVSIYQHWSNDSQPLSSQSSPFSIPLENLSLPLDRYTAQ